LFFTHEFSDELEEQAAVVSRFRRGGRRPEAAAPPCRIKKPLFLNFFSFSRTKFSPLLDFDLSFLKTHSHSLRSKEKEIIPLLFFVRFKDLRPDWYGGGSVSTIPPLLILD